MTGPYLGGKLGGRLAQVVADSTVVTRARTARITHDVAMQVQDSFFRLVGAEIRGTLGELFTRIADNPDAPEWARRSFDFLGRGHGQWQGFLAQSVGGQAIGVGLGALLTNELQPVTGNLIAQNPNMIISTGDAVNLAARGKQPVAAMVTEARRQGISPARFGWLLSGARRGLDIGSALDALNRGVISEAEARRTLQDAGLDDEAIAQALRLRRRELTPEQAAELENFGVLDRGQGRDVANRAGMSDADYDRLALGGGQPPPLSTLFEALRRGIIDRARFRKGVQQGPIRLEWLDVLDRLRFAPTPADAALSAATQNLITPREAVANWVANGFDLKDFEWALEANGRPLGIEQTAELFNRGLISEGFARQMYLESNIKNKYVPLIKALFERLPPMELTVRMVREGAMTKAEGIKNLRQLGFAPRWAQALVDLGLREQSAEDRALSVATIRDLYEGRAISRRVALDAIEAHGYDRQQADWLLAIADIRRDRSRQNTAVSRVRARFITAKIDQREAENALDRLGVTATERDDLVDTWIVEREVSAPVLTTAQTQQAARAGLITLDEAYDRFRGAGYDDGDANILTALAAPRPRRTT